MSKNKNRLDDSDITKFDKDAPPPREVSPEELAEVRKKLEEQLRAEVQKMLKKAD
jgi:hypothetical protein